MRFATILNEDGNYMGQLKNDINVYLTRLKANGVFNIDTDMMIRELESLGYTLTPESLVDILSNNMFVDNATVDSIDIVGGSNSVDGGDGEQATVKNMAKKATKKGMK